MEDEETCINNLLEYLNKILDKSDIIKKKDKYLINYDSLYNICQFSYLLEYCEENKYKKKNLITCEKLVYFLGYHIHQTDTIGANKKINTVGKVAMIFDLYFALYKTKYITEDYIVEDHYNYNVIYNYTWLPSLNPIAPFNRLAFKISHLIKQNIKSYYGDYLDIEFEFNFNDGTNKKYDILIKNKENKELMIIEIQEDSSNHNNSLNDKYKEFIINSKGITNDIF